MVTQQHGYYYGPKFVDEDTRTTGRLSNRTQDKQCRGECWDLDPGRRPGKHTCSPTALQCPGQPATPGPAVPESRQSRLRCFITPGHPPAPSLQRMARPLPTLQLKHLLSTPESWGLEAPTLAGMWGNWGTGTCPQLGRQTQASWFPSLAWRIGQRKMLLSLSPRI